MGTPKSLSETSRATSSSAQRFSASVAEPIKLHLTSSLRGIGECVLGTTIGNLKGLS